MKKIFAPAALTAWLAGILPDRFFFVTKKTPWYRKSWMANAPWVAGALMAPFALFLIWKGVSMLRQNNAEAGK